MVENKKLSDYNLDLDKAIVGIDLAVGEDKGVTMIYNTETKEYSLVINKK